MLQTLNASRARIDRLVRIARRGRANPPTAAIPPRNAPARRRWRFAVALTVCWSSAAVFAEAPLVCEQEMARAAQANAIPLNILYSVGLTETGHKGALNPYDMNVDGRSVHASSLADGLARVAYERAHGAKLIDIGCMQINLHWHGKNFASISEMFDPAHNVKYAASYLKQLRAREGTWTLAVARYNAGPDNPAAQKRYVCAVIGNMVAKVSPRAAPSNQR